MTPLQELLQKKIALAHFVQICNEKNIEDIET